MSLVGFRIDDRLLHGQVIENWIESLRPELVVVANAGAAGDPLIRRLYAAAMPPGIGLEVAPIAGAAAIASRAAERVLLIVGSPADALAVIEAGVRPEAITVGGLHHAGGKTRLLDFVYVDEGDREALQSLVALGLKLIAQDVPRHRPRDLAPLVASAR
jgi:mannose/fructose/N-acetylgalactosamine-specific phosphotransferase system component IIB